MQTGVYYNPITNELRTGQDKWLDADGFEYCGHKKFAEAMTTVNEEERIEIWKVRHRWGIDVNKLPSRLRHKLKKIGIKDFWDIFYETKGEYLLQKIKNKLNL